MLRRICCNPHIYTFCIIDSCLKKGSVEAFADSIGLNISAEQPSKEASKRCVPK